MPCAATGLTLAALAAAVTGSGGPEWAGLALALVGVVVASGAVAMVPDSRPVLLTAAVAALLAAWERAAAGWDSAALLLRVLAGAASAGAALVSLPRPARRAAVVGLVGLHFGGILTIASPASAGWVPQQLWLYFYRPYLQFMYLGDGYGYYAPEPPPSSLLYFRIAYEGGKRRWVKVPDLDQPEGNPDGRPRRPDGSLIRPHVQLTRYLEMVERANEPAPAPPDFKALYEWRRRAASAIPFDPDIPLSNQYRPPGAASRRWLAAYARHAARAIPYRESGREYPWLRAQSVKVYGVEHQIIQPGQLAAGWMPDQIFLYRPYYLGEFDPDGRLMQSCLRTHELTLPEGGKATVPEDALLYWVVPILAVPTPEAAKAAEQEQREPGPVWVRYRLDELEAVNYMLVHAGDSGDGRLTIRDGAAE